MIIGITGTLGSGKTTLAKYLSTKGFKHYSVSNFLRDEIINRGLVINRDSMFLVANDLRVRFGSSYIVEKIYDVASSVGGNSVVESLRSVGEVEALKKKNDFILISVDSDIETRYSRIFERSGEKDNVTFEEFLSNEKREMNSLDPTRGNIGACMEMADYKIMNDWTEEEFHRKVDSILESVFKKEEIAVYKKMGAFSAGILPDHKIKEKLKSGEIKIQPYDDSCVQPASYDLHLDNQFKIFKPHKTEIIDTRAPVGDLMENVFLEDGEAFVLHPGSFSLGLIKEVTGVDNKHVGRLEGKSSLARLGLLIHTTAGFLDPGNSLQMTLELFNASPLPIKLYPGMKVAQMAFEELQDVCEVPYGSGRGSSYFGASEVQESQMHKNFEVFDPATGFYGPAKS